MGRVIRRNGRIILNACMRVRIFCYKVLGKEEGRVIERPKV